MTRCGSGMCNAADGTNFNFGRGSWVVRSMMKGDAVGIRTAAILWGGRRTLGAVIVVSALTVGIAQAQNVIAAPTTARGPGQKGWRRPGDLH
jgi:hypothetical protein